EESHEHLASHLTRYKIVFCSLLLLTLVTVGVSYVDFGSIFWNFFVALVIATVKASLVAAVFMHLWGEKILIWRFLVFTTIFVAGLFLLTLLGHSDPIPQSSSTSYGLDWNRLHTISIGSR
ncbi:MAG: Prokaryotic Cytochrome oxidase subunit, partial [Verrucomicrobiota bacterium]